MAVKLYKEPQLKNSVLFCGWPGIGNIGITAIDTLRAVLRAQEFGEIEPWDFFDPRKVRIEAGLLKDLEFPSNKFYFQQAENQDLIFFIGQEQPSDGRARYAEGQIAYQMANLVLDVAEKFNVDTAEGHRLPAGLSEPFFMQRLERLPAKSAGRSHGVNSPQKYAAKWRSGRRSWCLGQ